MISKFRQLSVSLKLVVIWFLLFGLSSFWEFVSNIGAKHAIDLGSLLIGVIGWNLAAGLINRSNNSRWWAAFFTFLGSLFSFFLLAIAIFKDPSSTAGFNFNYAELTRTQTIILIVAFFILNMGTFFTLIKHKTGTLSTEKLH